MHRLSQGNGDRLYDNVYVCQAAVAPDKNGEDDHVQQKLHGEECDGTERDVVVSIESHISKIL